MKHALLYLILGCFVSCKPMETVTYDAYAYERTLYIQLETEQLIKKSNTNYNDHVVEIGELLRKISELKNYEQQRFANGTKQQLWESIDKEPNGLLISFLKHWEKQHVVSETFRTEAQKQLHEAFDILLRWEQQKDNTKP